MLFNTTCTWGQENDVTIVFDGLKYLADNDSLTFGLSAKDALRLANSLLTAAAEAQQIESIYKTRDNP